jgi:hypothetical protein
MMKDQERGKASGRANTADVATLANLTGTLEASPQA